MMEEIQNTGQLEDKLAVEKKELVLESDAVEEQQDQEPTDAPVESDEENDNGRLVVLWKALKEFLIKKKRMVLYVALALVAVVVAILIIHRNQVGKNRYETLVQTITEMKRISEFCTANYIGEVMIQDEEKHFLNHKNIVLIVRERCEWAMTFRRWRHRW